ncbi:MAG: hypothetical protein SFZ24_11215 [Planctomycetota bacterium]|nr:hypothetical protein [Planctomycetota bacterium]
MHPLRSIAPFAALVLALQADARRQETPPPETEPVPAPAPAAAAPPTSAVAIDEKLLAADALARAGLVLLRDRPNPSADDYRSIALLLRVVQRLRPEDPELARFEYQAWLAAGDEVRATQVAYRLVKLDPRDTVLQLRLIAARLAKLQDADQRLAAYDKLLGTEGAALDAAIRSRLALDAALLAREAGDEQGFVDRLTTAATLDPTNKEAAALYCTIFLDRTSDPQERVDLLAAVVLADPNDDAAHANLSAELLRHGAYTAAKRFLDRYGQIAASAGIDPGVEELFEQYLLVWLNEGDDALLDRLTGLENTALSIITQQRAEMERQGIEPGPMPEPLIPAELEILRLALAFAQGDSEAAQYSAQRMLWRLEEQDDALRNRRPPYDRTTEQDAVRFENESRLQGVMARLWAGLDIEAVEPIINQMVEGPSGRWLEPPAEQRLRGLLALRQGDLDRAQRLLEPVAPLDRFALMGLGMLAEERGDRQAAVRSYARLALEHAGFAVGAAARRRIEIMLGKSLAPTPTAAALNEWSQRFAPFLDDLTGNPSSFMQIVARHDPSRVDSYIRPLLRVSLRNSARIPLSLGPEHAINSRILLTPRVLIRGEEISSIVPPEPIEMDRRLRLLPGETLEVDVWATRAGLGIWLERFADTVASVRWRLIQAYRMGADNRFQPGLVSVTAQSDVLSRDPIPEVTDPAAIQAAFATARGRSLFDALLQGMMLAAATRRGEEEQTTQLRLDMAAAIAQNMPQWTEFEQTYAIAIGSRGGFLLDNTSILDATRDSTSPFVRCTLMLVGYTDPDDPGLVRLSEDVDPEIRELAQLTRKRLASGEPAAEEQPVDPDSPEALDDEPAPGSEQDLLNRLEQP